MQLFQSLHEWQKYRSQPIFAGKSLGFVPTMGNLHAGHASLLQQSSQDNAMTLLSIFVNPSQFNHPEDFVHYPQTLSEDLQMAQKLGVDFVLAPSVSECYPDHYHYQVIETQYSQLLEGQYRPGHFTGMLTIVLKLLMLAKATRVYFGEKDYQQLQLIKGMVSAFFIDTEVVACPTVRDSAGLALSSRNQRLAPEEYRLAQQFAQLLASKKSCEEMSAQLVNWGIVIDYIEEREGRRLAAVHVGKVRLIDNRLLSD